MRWYHIDHITHLAGARSYRKAFAFRRWALVIVRREPPNLNQTRKPGQ